MAEYIEMEGTVTFAPSYAGGNLWFGFAPTGSEAMSVNWPTAPIPPGLRTGDFIKVRGFWQGKWFTVVERIDRGQAPHLARRTS